MSEPKVIEDTIAADWWLLAGALQALLDWEYERHDTAPGYDSGLRENGYDVAIYERGQPERVLARVLFSVGPAPTRVRIEAARARGVYTYCQQLYHFLGRLAGGADIIRRKLQPTADNVIQRYYRAKAAGGKVTLKMLAEETGYSYEYLRKAKQRYDRAGKWGSKKGSLQGNRLGAE